MDLADLARRTAERIVTDALNAHGGKAETFDQIEQEIARALEEAYGTRGTVFLVEPDPEPCALCEVRKWADSVDCLGRPKT